MKVGHAFRALLVTFALLATFAGCDRSEPDAGGGAAGGGAGGSSGGGDIVVGHYGSMTGGQATFGTSTRKGIDLALDEINSGGGVLGRPVRVVHEDTQSSSTQAVNAVQKLINRDKVVALLGEVASSNSLAAGPVAQEAQIPMLSPASTNPKVTEVGDYVFRSCFIDPFQGGTMAQFAVENLKAKRLAILYDVNSDYSRGLRQFFTEKAKQLGAEIVGEEAYNQGAVDFKVQLTKLRGTNPQAIYVPGYYTEVGAIARQAKELGINVPLMGGDGWDSDKTPQIAGDAINGHYFTNHYSAQDKRPEVQKFVTDFKAKYNGETPDAMAILGYDAMKIMADAIKRAGDTNPQKIRDALAATKDFPAASGVVTFNANRDAEKPIVILKYENGAPTYVTDIKP